MSATIEHEKRKREILEKAIDVFSRDGYADTTFQKIADRCGISRTILYIYFKDKRDIFRYAIKLVTEGLEEAMVRIENDRTRSVSDRLVAIFNQVLTTLDEKRTLMAVILEYLMHLRKSGGDAVDPVRRRTIRIRHHFSILLNEGRNSGEFRPDFSGAAVNTLLYGLIEAAAFRIAIFNRLDAMELNASVRLTIEGLTV